MAPKPEAVRYARKLKMKGFTLSELARQMGISVEELKTALEELEKEDDA